MNRYQSLGQVDKLIQTIAERDRMIAEQLTILNKNVAILVQNSRNHSSGVNGHLQQLGRKQDLLIQIQRELLQIKKTHTGLETTNTMLTDASQLNPIPRLSQNSLDVGSKLVLPTKDLRNIIETRGQVLNSPKQLPSPKKNKDNDSRPPTDKVHKAPAFPTRMALVPFQQKQIIVDISKIFTSTDPDDVNFKLATTYISTWVAQLYDSLSKQAFSGYFGRYLSEQDAKVFFTHNLAINFERMTEFFYENYRRLWDESGQDLIEHFQNESANVLEFMMVKYPQKQKAYLSDQVRNAIRPLNRSNQPQFDILRNTNLLFDYDPTRKTYHRRVKIFLNRIITESQMHIAKFRTTMKQMFTIGEGTDKLQLSNQIGMKFKQNTPLYSQREIDQDGIQIKTPEILRVIIKWIAELEKKIRGFLDGTLIHNAFSSRQSQKPQYLNRFMKQFMNEFMTKKQPMFKQASAEMRLRIRSMLNLLPQYFQKYMPYFRHIKPTDVKSGLLSYILAEAASNLSTNYLLFLIDLLEEAAKVCKRYEGTVQLTTTDSAGNSFKETATFFDLEFVSFTISDLLRCRCTGSLDNIKRVYDKMSSDPRLTVYRVKNRIDTSNKDFLINVKLNGTPILCEVQLAITDRNQDQKQEYLNHFSHFMYELSRASYGPIAQAVIINSYLTQFVPFFKEELAKIPYVMKPLPYEVKVSCSPTGVIGINGYVHRNNDFSFVCTNCLSFRVANSSHIDNFDSSLSILSHDTEFESYQKAKKIICGDCAYVDLNNHEQSLYILGFPLAYFFQALGDGEIPPLVCAVQKVNSVRNIRILQRCNQGSSVSYVPVFYECKLENYRVELKDIKHECYLFTLKEDAMILNVDAERLWKLIDPQETEKKVAVEYFPIKVAGLQFNSPKSKKNIPSIQIPTYRRKQSPKNINVIKLRELLTDDQIPADLMRFYEEEKELLCSIPHEKFNFLGKLRHMKIQLLASKWANCVIILNTFHTPQSLARLTKHGRQLKAGQMKTMQKSLSWKLQRNNLDNNSFAVFKDNVDAEEINLMHNNITDLHFVKAANAKKIDLAGNQIQKVNLESKDFPKLESLDISCNNVNTIERLSHDSLQKLFLSVNKINTLNQINWNLQKLTHLELTNNRISHIDLTSISHIEALHLGQNPLYSINFPPCMKNLHTLYLFKNNLKTLDLSSRQFPSLKKLYLNHNELRRVELPQNLCLLQELVLQGNCLMHIHLPINMNSLQLLDISSNNINNLDIAQIYLPRLQQLFVCNNVISTIFWNQEMPQLQVLNLGHNFLRELDLSRVRVPSLSKLIISSNYIIYVTLNPEEKYLQLKQICTTLNPFTLPIPSNVNIETGTIFPSLSLVDVGVCSILQCTLWLLRRQSQDQRHRIYDMAEQKERRRAAKWSRDWPGKRNPHPPKLINNIENAIGETGEQNLGEEIDQEAFIILELMREINLIPQAHFAEVDEMLLHVRLTTL